MSNIPDRIPPRVSVNKEDQAGPPPAKEEDRISRLAHKVMETLSAIKQQVTPKRSERSGSDDQSRIASHLNNRLSDVSKISNPDAQKAEVEQIDEEAENLPKGYEEVIKQLKPEIEKMRAQAEKKITPHKPSLPPKPARAPEGKPLPPPKPKLSAEQQQRIRQFTQADKKSSIPEEFTKLIAEHANTMGPSSEGAQTVSVDPKTDNTESAHAEEMGPPSTSEPDNQKGVKAGGEKSARAAEGRSSLLGRVTKGLLGHLKALGGKIQSVATKVWDTVLLKLSAKEFEAVKQNMHNRLIDPKTKEPRAEVYQNPEKLKNVFETIDNIKGDYSKYWFLTTEQKTELETFMDELKEQVLLKAAEHHGINEDDTDSIYSAISREVSRKSYRPLDVIRQDEKYAFVMPYVEKRLGNKVETTEINKPFLNNIPLNPDDAKTPEEITHMIMEKNTDLESLSLQMAQGLRAQSLKIYSQLNIQEFAADQNEQPNIGLLANRFNQLNKNLIPEELKSTRGIKDQQKLEELHEKRAKILQFYSNVIEKLSNQGDYDSALVLYTAISRLDTPKTKEHLTKNTTKRMKKLNKLFDTSLNSKALFNDMKSLSSKGYIVIPPTGIITRAIEPIKSGGANELEHDGKINPDSLNVLNKIFEQLEKAQEKIKNLDNLKLDSPLYIKMKTEPPKRDKGKEKI